MLYISRVYLTGYTSGFVPQIFNIPFDFKVSVQHVLIQDIFYDIGRIWLAKKRTAHQENSIDFNF